MHSLSSLVCCLLYDYAGRLPRALLHEVQAGRRLARLLLPPRDSGVMWSAVVANLRLHIEHSGPSFNRMALFFMYSLSYRPLALGLKVLGFLGIRCRWHRDCPSGISLLHTVQLL